MTHHLNILAGQEYRMPVRLVDAAGHAVPIADYDVYGAARRGSETTRMSVAVVDGSSCVAIIPPLEQASYTYDLYLRHQSTTAEVQLLAGNIAVRGRVASMPPVTGGGEDVVAVVSADMTEVPVTVTPIAVATPDAWDRLDRAGDLLAEAIETTGALVPDAQRVIRQEVEAGQSAITEASADAVRQAGADIAGAGDREVASAADHIRAVSGQEADAIAAAGDAATFEALTTISTAVDGGINAIDDSIIRGTTAVNNATNTGVTAIGQSITAGTSEIQAATTAGTGTITDKVTASMQLLDGYVGTVSDDLARYSKAGQWTGVQTLNAPLIANGGIIAQGADLIKTIYTAALMDALYCDTAAGWTDKYAGATSGSGYNSLYYGAESSTSYLGKTAAGVLTRTDYTHQMVCKHLAIFGNDCMAGITAVVNLDQNAFWGAGNQLTGYCFGQAMQTHADVPFDRMIDPDYTPNVGGTPTVMFSAAPGDQIRVDIYYSTIHRQVIVPKISNVSQRSYRQMFVVVWTPTRFMVHLLPSFPATDWRCIARIDALNMNNLYRTSIIGWQDTNSFRVNISLSAHALNTYAAAGYGDWMQPLIHIIA